MSKTTIRDRQLGRALIAVQTDPELLTALLVYFEMDKPPHWRGWVERIETAMDGDKAEETPNENKTASPKD